MLTRKHHGGAASEPTNGGLTAGMKLSRPARDTQRAKKVIQKINAVFKCSDSKSLMESEQDCSPMLHRWIEEALEDEPFNVIDGF